MKRIVFSLPMVRALRAGLKTETRRTSPPAFSVGDVVAVAEPCIVRHFDDMLFGESIRCCYLADDDYTDNRDPEEIVRCSTMKTVIDRRLRSGRFMPGWAERTRLRIVGIEEQRLGDITEADAVAEGFADRAAFMAYFGTLHSETAQEMRVWVIRFEVTT